MSSSRPQDRVLAAARHSSRDAERMSIASSPAPYLSGHLYLPGHFYLSGHLYLSSYLCEPSRSSSPRAGHS
jgi:hypothetical protein